MATTSQSDAPQDDACRRCRRAVANPPIPLIGPRFRDLIDRPAGMGCRGDLRTVAYQETKMPKLKTKSGVKKRFKITATGKVKHGVAGKRHRLISHNCQVYPPEPRHQRARRRRYGAREALGAVRPELRRLRDGTRQTRRNHARQAQAGPRSGEGLLRPPQEHDPHRQAGGREGRAIRLSRPQGEEAQRSARSGSSASTPRSAPRA